MKSASRRKIKSKPGKPSADDLLRLANRDTRIRGMNIAAEAAREYLKQAGKPRVWPGRVARLIDANLSLMGQRIMVRVRSFERAGQPEEAERAFRQGMKEIGMAVAKELLARGA